MVLRWRRWFGVAAGLVAAVLLVVGLLHVRFVRARVLTLVADQLRWRTGVDLVADSLDYNLLTLSFRLEGVRLRAMILTGDAEGPPPFLEADSIAADLPWSVVGGDVGIQALELRRPRVTIVRLPDGSFNLPRAPTRQATGPGLTRLPIARLDLTDGEVTYRDETRALSVIAAGLAIDLRQSDAVGGRLEIANGIGVRYGSRDTKTEALVARLGYDGSQLRLESLDVVAPEARVQGQGRVWNLFSDPTIDVSTRSRLDLGSMSRWLAVDPAPTGHVDASVVLTGAATSPTAAISLDGAGLTWSGLTGVSVKGEARTSGAVGELTALDLAVAGGTISASGRVALGSEGESAVRAEWSGLDLATLLDALPMQTPLRMAARLSGSLQASWREPRLDSLQLVLQNAAQEAPRVDRHALAVAGRSSLAIERGVWRLSHTGTVGDMATIARAQGRAVEDAMARSPMTGTLHLTASDVGAGIAELLAAGVPLEAVSGLQPGGSLDAQLVIDGTLGAPALSGPVRVDAFTLLGLQPGGLDVRVALDADGLRADGLVADVGGGRLTGEVAARFADRTLDGRVDVQVDEAAVLLGRLPSRWRPAGAAEGSATVGGRFSDPIVDLTITAAHVDVAGQQLDRVTARARLEGRAVVVDTFEARQPGGGHLSASGRYGLDDGRYRIGLEASGIEIDPVPGPTTADDPLPLDATTDVRLDGEGTLREPSGTASVVFRRLAWRGVEAGPARADLRVADGVATVRVTAEEVATSLDGSLALQPPRAFTLRGTAGPLDVGRLARALGLDDPHIDGVLRVDVSASGDVGELDQAHAEIALRQFEARREAGVLTLVRPATIRYDAGTLSAEPVELRAGGSVLTISGSLMRSAGDGRLELSLHGLLEDVLPFVPTGQRDVVDVGGTVALRATATGPSGRPSLTADLEVRNGRIAAAGLPEATEISVTAGLRDEVLDLENFRGSWQGTVLSGSGRVPARLLEPWLPAAIVTAFPAPVGPGRLTIRADPLTQAALEPWVSDEILARLDLASAATLTLEADEPSLDAVRGELVLDRLDVTAAGASFGQPQPTRLTLADRRLRVDELALVGAGFDTRVTGEVGLGTRTLDLQVVGNADLRAIGALLAGEATAGRADLNVRIGGTLDEPELEGRIDVAKGELRVRRPRIVVSDLSGTIDLTGDRITTGGLSGTLNGGSVSIGGGVQRDDEGVMTGGLTLSGRGMALQIPQGLRTEVDTDLTLTLGADTPRLSGTLNVRRGAYRETIVITAQLLDQLASRNERVDLGTPSALDPLRLDVAIVTENPILLDNNYGRLQIETDLRVGGTVARPVLGGRLTLAEGDQLFLGGRTYQIERGSIVFVDPSAIKPEIDLAARTQVGQYDIRLTASGTADSLTTTLTSETEATLTEDDLVSLLVTGQTAEESGALFTAQSGVQVLQLLSGDILGFAGRAVGLDSVRLERGQGDDLFGADPALVAAETDPGQRVSVSKKLSSQVEIVLSQSLKESGGATWIAIYRPTRTIETRIVTRDDDSRAVQLSQQLQFGGGARVQARPTVTPLVESVRITGVPETDVRDLRSRVKVAPGRQLDFYAWQEDRDALERYYRDRGRFEAEVTVHRTDVPGDQPAVAVEYEVEPGPRTRLSVTGDDLPGNVRSDIARLWAGAIFDTFLIEDVRARILRSLARQGFLQPTVTATVQRDVAGDEKELRVVIERGPRTANRVIAFEGTDAISRDRLDAEVERRRLDLVVWLQPRDFEAAIVNICRREGLLAATVSVGTPRFEADTATVPVRISEGPVFVVGDVRLAGMTVKSADDLRATFGLSPGDAYRPADVDEGRRRIDASYRAEGFNDVIVRVERDVDLDAGQVALAVDVEEGARQVLSSVTLEGLGATNRRFLDRVLRLPIGEPIVADDWFDARRRLYETGVFKSVDVRFEAAGRPVTEGGVTDQPTRAHLTLVPAPLYRFRYGFELADEPAPSGEGRTSTWGVIADLQRRNLFGHALTVGGTGRLETDLWLIRGFASVPRFYMLPFTTSLYLTRTHQEVRPEDALAYVEERWIVTAEQEHRRGRAFRLSWGYRYERNHLFDPALDPDDDFPLDITVDIARLTSAATLDERDNPFSPRGGWFAGGSIEYAVPTLGSDIDFFKTFGQASYFKGFGPLVLASAVRIGGIFGPDQLFSELFKAGGGMTVRGYPQDSLGSRDFLGEPIGGEGLLIFNQEARLRLWRWFGVVGFVDAGNVFAQPSDISVRDLNVGLGVGLRLDTPIILVRVDFGMPVPRPEGSPLGRWYFALGHIF